MKVPNIAILVDTATGWGRRIVRGVLDYSKQWGPWNIWIEPKGQNEKFDISAGANLQGVIARVSSNEQAVQLKTLRVPVVNISGLVFPDCDFPRVTTNWHAGARLAETHFRARGLRHFAYVGPIHLGYVRAHERAFEEVLGESRTKCHVYQPRTQASAASEWIPTESKLIAWLQTLPKPIGIYTWGFESGRAIINACRRADIHVPHDVAVLGGDFDELLSDACHPALSGVVTPAKQIGYQAGTILDTLMRGGPPPGADLFIDPDEVEARLSTEFLAIDDKQIRRALTFLREHACRPIQVGDVLREVPMARRSLERRFLRLVGHSPSQEILRVRVEKARELLTKSDLSMPMIAEACGFATYNHLGTVFKRQTGMSPRAYRKKARSG